MNRRRIGIKEVASAAGVSVTTVSHALSGKGRLPESTRERVRRAAAELDYSPNMTARNLVVGKSGLLALAVSQRGTPAFSTTDFAYFAQLMMAASTAAMRQGYALVLSSAEAVLDASAGLPVDGAVIVDPVRDDDVVAGMRRAGIPVVTTGRVPGSGGESCWVDNDHLAGTRTMLDHLARQGGERIALLTSGAEISYTVDVERAYRQWCAENAVEPLIRLAERDLTERAGIAAAADLFDLAKPPDAIFSTYDRLAFGVQLAAESRGIRVPEDLLLATTATESQAPAQDLAALTTLDLDPEEIGRRAAELLIDLLGDDPPEECRTLVAHRVIPRSSTRRRETTKGAADGS